MFPKNRLNGIQQFEPRENQAALVAPPPVSTVTQQISTSVQQTFAVPDELLTLIAEAVHMAQPEAPWRALEHGETSISALANGALRLNLRAVQGMTRGVHATVATATANTPIMAHIFRGHDQVAALQVPVDGAFAYENEEGITDIVFQPTAQTTVTLGSMQVSAFAGMPAASTDELTNFTSKDYALSGAPAPLPVPIDIAKAALRLELGSSPNGSGEKRFYDIRDASKYTLYRIQYTQGSGRIAEIGTLWKTGTDYMGREQVATSGFPSGYLQRIDDNTVLIAPGAPAIISFFGGFTNAVGRLVKSEGVTAEELLPPATMNPSTVDTGILKMNEQFREEGVFPGVTEVNESSSPVFSSPGHQANVQYQVHNDALNGGKLGFDVYVGWYAGQPERGTLQKHLDATIGGGQTIMLSVNVTAPSRPADATSDRPIISIVTRFPNGQTEVGTKLGKQPQSIDEVSVTYDSGKREISWKSAAYTADEQARIRTLTERALNALKTSPDTRLQAIRSVLGDDRIAQLFAESEAAGLAAARQQTDYAKQVDAAITTLETVIPVKVDLAYADVAVNQHQGEIIGSSRKELDNLQKQTSLPEKTWANLDSVKTNVVKFELTQDSMVNVWLTSVNGMDLSIYKDNVELFPGKTNSDVTSGRSISAKMPKGTYEVRATPQQQLLTPGIDNLIHSAPSAILHLDIIPALSSSIVGKLSREGSPEVFDVSLKVAEFLTNGKRNTNYDGKNQNLRTVNVLNPSKPVWVIVHGMNSKENSLMIEELTRQLFLYEGTQNIQVVTIDWQKAAKDLTNTGLDVVWTDAVGKWAAQQLMASGFAPSQINGAGHSHGNYVLYSLGKELMNSKDGQQMNSLIALDPAGNAPLWSGYNHTKINFGAVSARSIAFESSFIADSDFLAGTSDISFRVTSPTLSPINAHSLGFSTFTTILTHERTSSGAFSNYLSFKKFMTLSSTDINQYKTNTYRNVFEAEIDVGTMVIGQGDESYLQGIPTALRYMQPGSTSERKIRFTTKA